MNSPPQTIEAYVDDVVRRHAALLHRVIHEAATAILDDPAVVAEGQRAARAETTATARRDELAGRYRNDFAVPTTLLQPGVGFPGAVRALSAERASGFRRPHIFYRFLAGNSIVNEQQSVRGPGGIRVGSGVLLRGGARRQVNYDALVTELRQHGASRGMDDRATAAALRRFVQTGRGGGGPISDFARIAFTVEARRSTSFLAEGPMLMRAVERGDLTMAQAFSRNSAFNPLSPQGAAAANRMFDERELGIAGRMRPNDNSSTTRSRFQEIRERRIRLLQVEMLAVIRAEGLRFHDDASFVSWANTVFRRHVENQARAFFSIANLPTQRLPLVGVA